MAITQYGTGMYDTNVDYRGPSQYDAIADIPRGGSATGIDKGQMLGGAGTLGVGLFTQGTGWIVAGLLQLGSGILGSMLGRKRRSRTSEEIYFDHMVDFYRKLGERTAMARSAAKMYAPNMSDEKVNKIGYSSTAAAMKAVPFTQEFKPVSIYDKKEKER